jgi:hypothetical protein
MEKFNWVIKEKTKPKEWEVSAAIFATIIKLNPDVSFEELAARAVKVTKYLIQEIDRCN